MRVTWLTDIHLNFLRPLALQQFYERVRAERPDAVVISGDIAESNNVDGFLDGLAAHVRTPVYFVLGNHDYYRSSVRRVRETMQLRKPPKPTVWLQAADPVQLSPATVMIGVDGWGDARAGDALGSPVMLSDWKWIDELTKGMLDRTHRIATLQRLGANDARALRDQLARVPACEQLLVVTHVPPFAEACFYDGAPSGPAWLPWFTCLATGEVLLEYATAHPAQRILVLCGHSHGLGTYSPLPNLEVRNGGWPPNVEGYGNPIVQATLEL